MLKALNKHENKEQGKTRYETPRSKNHKATQCKNKSGITTLADSINYQGWVKALLLSTNLHPGSNIHIHTAREFHDMNMDFVV